MTAELKTAEEIIIESAIIQARKINNQAIEILTTPNHPDSHSVIYSKWEDFSIIGNQTTTVYSTQRALADGQTVPMIGFLAESAARHPGLASSRIITGSDTTMYRHYPVEKLIGLVKDSDLTEQIKASFPDGTLMPVNPTTLELDQLTVLNIETIEDISFEKQLYTAILSHARHYLPYDKNLESILNDITRTDPHNHPESEYEKLFKPR